MRGGSSGSGTILKVNDASSMRLEYERLNNVRNVQAEIVFKQPDVAEDAGFGSLSEVGCRFDNPGIYVVAGNSGVGKSSFLIELAVHKATHLAKTGDNSGPVVFITYQESLHYLYAKFLACLAAKKCNGNINYAPNLIAVEKFLLKKPIQDEYTVSLEKAAEEMDALQKSGFLALVDGGNDARCIEDVIALLDSHPTPSVLILDSYHDLRLKNREMSWDERNKTIADNLEQYSHKNNITVVASCPVELATSGQPEIDSIRDSEQYVVDRASCVVSLYNHGNDSGPSTVSVKVLKNRNHISGGSRKFLFYGERCHFRILGEQNEQ